MCHTVFKIMLFFHEFKTVSPVKRFGTYLFLYKHVIFCWQLSSSNRELEPKYMREREMRNYLTYGIYEHDHTDVGTNRVQRPESVKSSISNYKPYDNSHYANNTEGTSNGSFGKTSLVSSCFQYMFKF